MNFIECHCLQLFSVPFDKNLLVFQSSKKSYLKLGVSFDISFVVSLECHGFVEVYYYVVIRTFLWFQGLTMYYLCDIDFLYLIFCFRGMLRWFFYPLLTKEPKSLCFCEDDNIILKMHFHYNTLNHLTYYKQSYCKDIKICTTFGTPEG